MVGFVVGAALFFAGVATAMGVVFTSGGVRKSQQFRVLGEVLSGRAGSGRRALLLGALLAAAAGALVLFGSVAAGDRARAQRCDAFCRARGFDQGRIGPADDPAKRVVSCTCTASDGRREQRPAHEVPNP